MKSESGGMGGSRMMRAAAVMALAVLSAAAVWVLWRFCQARWTAAVMALCWCLAGVRVNYKG